MALIKTLEEIKEVLPKLVSNLNDSSLFPNFDAVEQKYLLPLIGKELYDDLQTKYTANNLSVAELSMVKHIRLVAAAYGFLDEMAAGHVFITDNGVRVNSTDDMQKAVGWEYKELKKYLGDRAIDATEILLNYLWDRKEVLPLWVASEAYKQFESLLIRTGRDFNDHYALYQPMRTFYSIKGVMRKVQKKHLQKTLGKDLLDYFIDLTDPSDQEEEILESLKQGLAALTVRAAGEHYNVRFSESGFTVVSEFSGGDKETEDSGRGAASLQVIEQKMKACERDGLNFLSEGKKLLVLLRANMDAVTAEFISAYDKGPLSGYIAPGDRNMGNDKRKIFRT